MQDKSEAKEISSEIQVLKKLGPNSTAKDYDNAAKQKGRKRVSGGRPKFLGHTTDEGIKKDFPNRDPKFIGRSKNNYKKTAAK
jgi:hypothetical protein